MHSINTGGMNNSFRGFHLFKTPFLCYYWQHHSDGLLCYKTFSPQQGEKRGCVGPKSISLPQWETDVSVDCLRASACGEMLYIGQDAVSPTRTQVLFQRRLRYKDAWVFFRGVMFTLGSSLYPETWIKFYTGQPGSWQQSPTCKWADGNAIKGEL